MPQQTINVRPLSMKAIFSSPNFKGKRNPGKDKFIFLEAAPHSILMIQYNDLNGFACAMMFKVELKQVKVLKIIPGKIQSIVIKHIKFNLDPKRSVERYSRCKDL